MKGYRRYLAWMGVCREPALLHPIVRYWLGSAYMATMLHFCFNTHQIWPQNGLTLITVLRTAAIPIVGVLFAQISFSRMVGDMNLGQATSKINWATLSRNALFGLAYGAFSFKTTRRFDAEVFVMLPCCIALTGLLFEATLGRLSFFRPVAQPGVEIATAVPGIFPNSIEETDHRERHT